MIVYFERLSIKLKLFTLQLKQICCHYIFFNKYFFSHNITVVKFFHLNVHFIMTIVQAQFFLPKNKFTRFLQTIEDLSKDQQLSGSNKKTLN